MVSARAARRLETLIWVLIYGGLLGAILGVFTRESDPATGAWLITAGTLAAAAGAVLIGVRARLTVAPDTQTPPATGHRSPAALHTGTVADGADRSTRPPSPPAP